MTGTIEELKVLMDDEEFVNEIAKMDNNVEVQKAFEARGIGFTMDEIDCIVEKLYGEKSELSDESLEQVSGGFVITLTTLEVIGCVSAGVGLFAGVMEQVNKNRKAKGKKAIW
jgi:hypothetical protein